MTTNRSIKPALKWLIGCLFVAATVLAVRHFCVGSYRISTDAMRPTLEQGDFILVNKLACMNQPEPGSIHLFSASLPDTTGRALPLLLLARCIGMPGDTVRLTDSTCLVVPRKERAYRLDEESLAWCWDIISQETAGKAVVRNGKLFLDGVESSFFFFRNDYYWLLAENEEESIDSRHLGPVSADRLIGKAWFCWYSKEKSHRLKPIH